MTITTEEMHKLWRALFDANWHKAAGALRSLAAERDALRAENEKLRAALGEKDNAKA
jgi:regulator of replication initiation timing